MALGRQALEVGGVLGSLSSLREFVAGARQLLRQQAPEVCCVASAAACSLDLAHAPLAFDPPLTRQLVYLRRTTWRLHSCNEV